MVIFRAFQSTDSFRNWRIKGKDEAFILPFR